MRSFPNAPRTLDIDLLLHGRHVLDLPRITLPHPRMTERPFVLVPLLEVAPGLTDPRTGRRFAEHLAALDATEMRRVAAGQELLTCG